MFETPERVSWLSKFELIISVVISFDWQLTTFFFLVAGFCGYGKNERRYARAHLVQCEK